MQRIAPAERRWPLSYYAPESGVGRIMRQAPMLFGAHARIGVVGLGAGTLACYARPGQTWRLFEIDPAVIGMATDPTKFTFLSQCAPQAPIIRGDGRLNLTNWKEAPFDLLVMDAFSSDAPPLHLLTSEAFDTYRQALARDGVIMVNISNRFMDFAPVLASMARAKGWSARLLDYQPDARGARIGYTRSVWVALAPGAPHPDAFAAKDGWRTLDDVEHLETWSDDKASIIPVMRLFRPAASIGD
jgi:spermidine synthase